MNRERWDVVKSRFEEAIGLPCAERETFLSNMEDIDAEVSSMLRALLAEGHSGPNLKKPCWNSHSPVRTWAASTLLLGRFEILEFIGAGGMGEVYRAYDRQQEVTVALKTLRPEFATRGTAVGTLRKELNAARSVTHENVCRLFDFHESDNPVNPPFVTMEFLEGETLSDRLANFRPLQRYEAERIARRILAGLEAVHNRGLIHRDLKSANVILSPNGEVHITDFGLARDVNAGATLESTLAGSAFAGTPAYMAPEQLHGERATFASDIHSMGVVLFELATGRRPFEGSTPLDIALQRLNNDAPSPRKLARHVDRRWEYTVLRCLERDARLRPQSAAAVEQMLSEPAPLLWNRRRALWAIPGAVPVVGGGWIAAAERHPAPVKVFDFDNRTGRKEFDYLCRGAGSELIRALSHVKGCRVFPARAPRRTGNVNKDATFAFDGFMESVAGSPRLTVELFNAGSGATIWSRSYGGGSPETVLAAFGGIAESAAMELERQLPINTVGRLVSRILKKTGSDPQAGLPTSNSIAFDRYLRGANLLQEGSATAITDAIRLLQEAIDHDPHFALALAALAEASMLRMNYSYSYDAALARDARNFAELAVREQPEAAEAHAVLAASRQLDWNWPAAEASYNEALKLKPGFARARRWRGGLRLQFARFDEALGDMRTAMALDPYDRAALSGYGLTLLFSGRERECASMLEVSIGDRDLIPARNILSQAYARLGSLATGVAARQSWFDKALAVAATMQRLEQLNSQAVSAMSGPLFALIHTLRGADSQAAPYLNALEETSASKGGSPVLLAMVYASAQRIERALDAVELAIRIRDRYVLNIRVNVFLENLRGHDRFEYALRSIHLL